MTKLPLASVGWRAVILSACGGGFVLDQQATQPDSEWMYGHIDIFGKSDMSGFIQLTHINCTDNAGPLFAGAIGPIINGNGWSVAPDPVAPLTAPLAPPILVIAGTHDLRTPTRWGQELADSLERGVLLVSEHWGHTSIIRPGANSTPSLLVEDGASNLLHGWRRRRLLRGQPMRGAQLCGSQLPGTVAARV